MKIKDMNPEQLREYNRIQKQNQRERERQEAAAKRIPNANDFRMPIAKQAEIDKHANDILKTIQAELPDHRFAIQDEFVIETVACALFGLENDISQKVQNPDGMLVGGHFPDAVASTAVEHVHRFPNLLGSATFKSLYDKFLRAVMSWDGKYQHAYSSPELIHDVKTEISGTYILKPKFTPAAPAPAVPEVSVVQGGDDDEQIRERGRVQLVRQLQVQDPNVPAGAVCHLEHRR